MEKMQGHIQYVILCEYKNNKNAADKVTKKKQKKKQVLLAKVSLLTTEFEIGFQSFVLTICQWVMNQDQNAQQIFIEML